MTTRVLRGKDVQTLGFSSDADMWGPQGPYGTSRHASQATWVALQLTFSALCPITQPWALQPQHARHSLGLSFLKVDQV